MTTPSYILISLYIFFCVFTLSDSLSVILFDFFFFFFSSRRRHTRWTGDWSSDVCSSDLVITFQVLYFKVFPNLGDNYTACMIQRAKDSGASDQKIRQTAELAERLKRLYDKPATNAAVAFAEAFPVGAFAAVLSAAILRRREISSEN